MSVRFTPLIRPTLAIAAVTASLLLSSCASSRSWFQKSSGRPATFGTSVTLPFGDGPRK